MIRFVSAVLVLALAAGCTPGPRLNVGPSQAEFPLGTTIEPDGRIGADEWSAARSLSVVLPDGRRIGILMQRDRDHFQFAFVGLGVPAPRGVHPEILLDLWGNAASTWDDNDWYIGIDDEDCWQQGGWRDPSCAYVMPGLIANNFPIGREEAIEVQADFREMGTDESYDGRIGLAFRFVDETGREVAVWPMRAQIDDPDTWASIALRH